MSPRTMHVRAFAKVNLALAVGPRRPDGFHHVDTVFQTIDLCDELEVCDSDKLRLRCHGIEDLPTESNLVWRAASTMVQATSVNRGAEIVLRKRIPTGAGLGGGSSDAAATLLALCRLWGLKLPPSDLSSMAGSLGSDVPFFLHGGTAWGSGRGEVIQPLEDFPATHLLVIYPGVQVLTAQAYESLSLRLTVNDNANKIQAFLSRLGQASSLPAGIFNDFETAILPAHPEIREVRNFLDRRGATASMLCGSGSSVFGFFHDEESALAASRAVTTKSWRVFPAKTLSRAEYLQRMFG